MASLLVPRSPLPSPVAGLLLLLLVVTSFTAVADSARASAPAPTTAAKPIEVYPGCSKTAMPKRCSVMLSNLVKVLAETKATIAGPQLATNKLKTDSCITGCAKTVDEATSKATAAKADAEALRALRGYLFDAANDGRIGPCECNCPQPCSADESAAVKKLWEAPESMRDLADLLEDLIDRGDSEEARAEDAEMEKSMDSGVLYTPCGLSKEPQKCSDELSAMVKTTEEAKSAVYESKVKPSPALDSVINDCITAIENINVEIYFTKVELKHLADIHATLRSNVKGDGKKPPLCKYSCPETKPCSSDETAIVDKLSGVHNAWVAADKFITELITASS